MATGFGPSRRGSLSGTNPALAPQWLPSSPFSGHPPTKAQITAIKGRPGIGTVTDAAGDRHEVEIKCQHWAPQGACRFGCE